MKHVRALCAYTLLVVSLTGCGSMSHSTSSDADATRDVLQQINDSTTLAVNAQRELALTADSKLTSQALQRRRLLTDVISLDFYGDVEDILRDIALRYGFGFDVYGERPPERVPINVFVTKRPVLEVLRTIGYQYGLDVKVSKDRIELHYKAV